MKPILVANWKMYKTVEEATTFIEKIAAIPTAAELLLAVPFTAIAPAAKAAAGTHVRIGAQNMNDASEGAYTGEISARMLTEAGATFVIIGHSERRRLFHEDNAFIQRKIKRALESKLQPILCIGETFEEREAGETEAVIRQQLTECLQDIASLDTIMIAYEPVWAIGTGKAATAELAEEVHRQIRDVLASLYDEETAAKTALLYGGSATPDNAEKLLSEEDINGLLIGSASLQPESFAKIAAVCENTD